MEKPGTARIRKSKSRRATENYAGDNAVCRTVRREDQLWLRRKIPVGAGHARPVTGGRFGAPCAMDAGERARGKAAWLRKRGEVRRKDSVVEQTPADGREDREGVRLVLRSLCFKAQMDVKIEGACDWC